MGPQNRKINHMGGPKHKREYGWSCPSATGHWHSMWSKKNSGQTEAQHKKYIYVLLCNKHVNQRRPVEGKSHFKSLSGPKMEPQKRICRIDCLCSLLPMWQLRAAPPTQHSPINLYSALLGFRPMFHMKISM